jgi:hypothetical protein
LRELEETSQRSEFRQFAGRIDQRELEAPEILEGWNAEAFARNVLARTKKNVEAANQPWTAQVEAEVKQAHPVTVGRYSVGPADGADDAVIGRENR